MNDIEICTLNGVKWVLGEESPQHLNWQDAMDWCKSIGQELPPREVLLMAALNQEIRDFFANNFYWSSSEYDPNAAWYQYFPYGSQNYYDSKSSTLPVRAVRAIKQEPLTTEEKADVMEALELGLDAMILARDIYMETLDTRPHVLDQMAIDIDRVEQAQELMRLA